MFWILYFFSIFMSQQNRLDFKLEFQLDNVLCHLVGRDRERDRAWYYFRKFLSQSLQCEFQFFFICWQIDNWSLKAEKKKKINKLEIHQISMNSVCVTIIWFQEQFKFDSKNEPLNFFVTINFFFVLFDNLDGSRIYWNKYLDYQVQMQKFHFLNFVCCFLLSNKNCQLIRSSKDNVKKFLY